MRYQWCRVSAVLAIYVPSVNALLILGNSDAFAGGFVAGIVEGKSLDESVDMGHWLASLSIKELGPQYVHPLLTSHFIILAIIASISGTSKQHQRKLDIRPPSILQ